MIEVRRKDTQQEDPEHVAACIADARLDFSNDLQHHLRWMAQRAPGTHLEEAKHLRGVLDVYIQTEGTSFG